VLLGILKRTAERYQGPVLWAWLEIFFIPKSHQMLGQNEKSVDFQISPVSFFLSQYPNTYCHVKLPLWPFEAEHLKGKTSTPGLFYLPGGERGGGLKNRGRVSNP